MGSFGIIMIVLIGILVLLTLIKVGISMAAARRMASQVNQAAGAELAGGGGHIGGYHG